MRRTREDARRDKRKAVGEAEAQGTIADSMSVRRDLIRRMEAGEIAPADMQKALQRIKDGATKRGLTTLDRVYRNG